MSIDSVKIYSGSNKTEYECLTLIALKGYNALQCSYTFLINVSILEEIKCFKNVIRKKKIESLKQCWSKVTDWIY